MSTEDTFSSIIVSPQDRHGFGRNSVVAGSYHQDHHMEGSLDEHVGHISDPVSSSYPPNKSKKKKSILRRLFDSKRDSNFLGDDEEEEDDEVFLVDANEQRIPLRKPPVLGSVNSVADPQNFVSDNVVREHHFPIPTRKSNTDVAIYNEENNVALVDPEMELRKMRKTKKQERMWKELMSIRKTGLFFSIWNLINDIISPGTVSMPQVVAQSGLWLAVILFILFGIITTFTICLVYELSRNHLKSSLPELAMKGFGKIGFLMTCVFIFFFNFGGACAQFLMFGQVVPNLLLFIFNDPDNIYLSRNAVLIYLAICLFPIAMQKKLGSFAFFSFAAVFSVFGVAAIVMYELLFGPKRYIPHDPVESLQFVHPHFMSALGTLSYIYVCHDMSLVVVEELRRATRLRYYIVVFVTTALTVACCATMGICGYFLFWDTNLKEANVLDLFPTNFPAAIVGRCFLAISLTFSIPFSSFMPRNSIILVFKVLFPKWYNSENGFWAIDCCIPAFLKKKENEESKELITEGETKLKKKVVSRSLRNLKKDIIHYGTTLFVMGLALTIALTVTDLGLVFQITGGVSACSMAYILPCLLAIKLEPGRVTWLKFFSFVTLMIGFVILGSTIYLVIDQMVTGG